MVLSILVAPFNAFRWVYLYDDGMPRPFWRHLFGVVFFVGMVGSRVVGVLGMIWLLGLCCFIVVNRMRWTNAGMLHAEFN